MARKNDNSMQISNGRDVLDQDRLSVFELSGHRFGLDILSAREVLPLPLFTALPNSGRIYQGVFNLRGEIFPLIDVSPVLGLPPKEQGPEDMVIILESSEPEFQVGMLVDRIDGLVSYAPSEVRLSRGLVEPSMEIFIKGVLVQQKSPILLLDLNNLFRTRQLLAHF